MTSCSLTFDAVGEATPGPKWVARWSRSWPAYETWFVSRGSDNGPSRHTCEAALKRYMPELVKPHATLTELAGGTDRAARFLSTWCPPNYLGGCSMACAVSDTDVRLVRNYDLSPDLNEGLMLHAAWRGKKVMGMVEFLWGLSDGIDESGLSVALAYVGRQETGRGFGITTILRYLLETCDTVAQAVDVLHRVPSHMGYNVLVADVEGQTVCVEVYAGGGAKAQPRPLRPITSTKDHDPTAPGSRTPTNARRASHLFSRPNVLLPNWSTGSRCRRSGRIVMERALVHFLQPNMRQKTRAMTLHWDSEIWHQTVENFREGQRINQYGDASHNPASPNGIDWEAIGRAYATGQFPDWRSFVPDVADAA